jgi:putative ABC transport system permease protein
VAWLQLSRDKLRLLVGLAGVAFAVILVFMQMGFQRAMYESATRYHHAFDFDLALVSPKTPFIGQPEGFSRRRLYQALGSHAVETVSPVFIQPGQWKNPWEYNSHSVLVVGIDPGRRSFLLPEVRAQLAVICKEDSVLFDALSRPEYGPVASEIRAERPVSAEVNDRRVHVEGLFGIGTSFGVNGSMITSEVNFRRLFPQRSPGKINLGLIQLRSRADVTAARDEIDRALEDDVLVLTRAQYIEREIEHWRSTTPIGYVFGFGSIMGVIVGAVIVYQILFADVSQHLREYATLKAMGYSNRYLSGVVLQEAAILSVLGFLPGVLATYGLYRITTEATRLPLELTASSIALVLLFTIGMCGGAGLVALRKVRSADPAEVFG